MVKTLVSIIAMIMVLSGCGYWHDRWHEHGPEHRHDRWHDCESDS